MSRFSRRGFFGATLGALATAAAVPALDLFAIDPERALWVPGQRTHFLMPPGVDPPLIYEAIVDDSPTYPRFDDSPYPRYTLTVQGDVADGVFFYEGATLERLVGGRVLKDGEIVPVTPDQQAHFDGLFGFNVPRRAPRPRRLESWRERDIVVSGWEPPRRPVHDDLAAAMAEAMAVLKGRS